MDGAQVSRSSVVSGCVAVCFMVFSLLHYNTIDRNEKMNEVDADIRQTPRQSFGCSSEARRWVTVRKSRDAWVWTVASIKDA
jgi:hypothetical protein